MKVLYIILTIFLGADSNGHPTIDLKDCDGNIGKIHLIFFSVDWFIYQKLINFFDKYLKKEFGKLVRMYFTKVWKVITYD